MKRLFSLLALLSLPLAAGPELWQDKPPAEVCAAALTPDSVLDEVPCNWRPVLAPIFRPAVADCRSAREATLAIASRLGELTGVRYDTGRRHPCMNALEALAEKKVSCSGNSILLVCALRSVGIPARAVGVETWNHVPGNHTWAEAWFDGEWHMIEANEKDFNTPWVMEAVGMLAPHQQVLAVQPGGAQHFPTVWNKRHSVAAQDVSARYRKLAREWYTRNGVPEGFQKLMVDAQPRLLLPRAVVLEDAGGHEHGRAFLPGPQDDIRKFATLLLPRGIPCHLRIDGTNTRYRLQDNDSAARIIRLRSSTSVFLQR